jgi:hypothetical protein
MTGSLGPKWTSRTSQLLEAGTATTLLALSLRSGSAEGSVHSSYPEEAQERSAAATVVRDAIGRELRKMYAGELWRLLPSKFALLLSKLDGDLFALQNKKGQ